MKLLINDETQQTTTLETQTQIKEAIVNETLNVSLAGGLISALESYGGNDCEIAEAGTAYTFTASAPGLYRLKVTASTAVRQLLIRVVPRATLNAIPNAEFRTGYGQSIAPRLVLRSIVNHGPEAWDGSADWLWDNRIRLGDHGVIVPQV